MTAVRAAVLAIAALAGAGCMARVTLPPAPPAPPAWQGATATDALPGPDWWAGFGSAELLDLQRAALAANTDLAAALARVEQARGAARAVGAGRLPSVDLSAGVQRGTRGGGGDFGGDTDAFGDARLRDSGASTRHDVALVARYELDLWGRQAALALGGAARTRARAADLLAARISVQAEVALAYFRALALARQRDLAGERVELARERLRLIEARRAHGAASEVDLSAERAALAQLQASVPTLARDHLAQVHALAVLLGRAPQEPPALGADFATLRAPPVPAGLPAAVLARRPDVRTAQAELLGARADAAAARAALLPTFSLTAQGGGSSSALGEVLASEGRFWTLGLDVLTPIFDAGRLRGQRDQARAQAEERLALYRATVLGALREVEDALALEHQAALTGTAQADATAAAEQSDRLAQARHGAGATDRVARIDARRQALEARDAGTGAALARLEAAVGLFRALGGGYADGAGAPCGAGVESLECAPL